MSKVRMFPLFVACAAFLVFGACGDEAVNLFNDLADAAGNAARDTGMGGEGSGDEADAGNQTLDIGIADTNEEPDVTEPTGTDCIGILECVNTNQCQTQACLEQCVATGTPDAQDLFNAFFACIGTNCAGAATDEEFAECQVEQCGAELSACTGQQVGTGDLTCEEVFGCTTGCRDQACLQECLGNGTAGAQVQYGALVQCAAAACAESTSADALLMCFEENCPDEYADCFPVDGE